MANYRDQAYRRAPAGAMDMSIDQGLRAYMLRVYNLMALGVALTALVTLGLAANPAVMQTVAMGPMKWVLFLGVLGLGFFAPRLIMGGNKTTAHAAYWGYAALWGALISPMVFYFLRTDPTTVSYAFFSSAAMFLGTSLFGYTTKRDLSGMGGFFVMATIGLLIAIVINIFIQSTLFSLLTSCGVVVIFAGMTAYETQMIKGMYYEGDSEDTARGKAIFGAFALYGSFVTLFIHMLNILGILRSE